MNKRQRKKQFKKLYGMNPKQYQQAMQLVSLEEPLENLWIQKQLHLQIWGVALKELKMDCKISFCFGKIELRIVLFWVEQIEKELKKRR